ncbi:MAG: hypothetical protein M3Y74_11105 [Chloroflexota bacterium]|nr:hypothetical protein [Chloroflexota bacterium]
MEQVEAGSARVPGVLHVTYTTPATRIPWCGLSATFRTAVNHWPVT